MTYQIKIYNLVSDKEGKIKTETPKKIELSKINSEVENSVLAEPLSLSY